MMNTGQVVMTVFKIIEGPTSILDAQRSNTYHGSSKKVAEISTKPVKKNRRENSRLSMIDAMHAKKVSTGNIGDLKKQTQEDEEIKDESSNNSPTKPENEGILSALNDVSVNQTV